MIDEGSVQGTVTHFTLVLLNSLGLLQTLTNIPSNSSKYR